MMHDPSLASQFLCSEIVVTAADTAPRVSEVAFIDPNVEDIDVLLAGLRPGVQGILLNAQEPAPRQMARALESRRDLQAIHVIAHGAPGEVQFAAGVLSPECLDDAADDLAVLGRALECDGELLLWSCHTGADARGNSLVQGLARATGARTAASTHWVGAVNRGGRWELDTAVGRA